MTSNEQLNDLSTFFINSWLLRKQLKLKQKQYQTYDATK